MQLVRRKVSELQEHPKNKDYFSDITGDFWSIFLEDIRENGIREPLSLNTVTGYIFKGCQRLRAARELGIEEVDVLEEEIHEPESELDELIRDNVMRREVDMFTKFRLVGILREKVKGKKRGPKPKDQVKKDSPENEEKLPPIDRIAQMINESRDTVTMAALFDSLSPESKEEVKEWFYSQDKVPSKKDLDKEIRLRKDAEDKVETLWEQMQGKEGEIEVLQKQLAELGEAGKKTADLEQLREQVKQLQKRKKELLEEQRGLRILTNVLTRSRDFFSNECLQLPAVAASAKESSQELMKAEVVSFIHLVDNWKLLLMKSFGVKSKDLKE